MSERAGRGRSWTALARVALACAALSAGCASSDDADNEFYNDTPGSYQLGGQTGSLIPRCGLAPLSAQGQSVPAGRALAVFYSADCPELAMEGRLALLGAGLGAQPLELVPLAADTYLLQAGQSLPAGDYALELDQDTGSALSVAEGELLVPPRFGTLRSETAPECSELLQFTLELEERALALAPLARFEVSIDGGRPQLWVDYGALRIETDESGSRGVLELPLCGAGGSCISPGPHELQLQVLIAGQSSQPEPIEHVFEPCPWPQPASEGSLEESCALSAPVRPSRTSLGWLLAALGLGWCRRRARVAQRRERESER